MELDIDALQLLPSERSGLDFDMGDCSISCSKSCLVTCTITDIK